MQDNARTQEMEDPRDRLSRLSEATLRITETLDFHGVLQEVVDSARALTDARYGAMTTVDNNGQPEELLTSGMTQAEHRLMAETPRGTHFFEYFSGLPEPLRVPDFRDHTRSLGLPEFQVVGVGPFLAAPIRRKEERMGTICLAKSPEAPEFSREDEEVLTTFAAQALLVIANARRYRDEQRARARLETLIDTSPVGVAVLDGRTGLPVSLNREILRIVEHLQPGGTPEQLLKALTFRRADGREVSLAELPVTEAIGGAETWRAEEIVLHMPDGPSMRTLVNATPIYSDGEEGDVEATVVAIQDMTPLEDLARLRAEFLGMVSHELRSPLTSIKGAAATLRESMDALDPAEAIQFAGIIESQANHMRDLISELLDVAHIETGSLSVSLEPVDVGSLVDEAKRAFPSGLDGNNVVVDLEPGLPLVVADRRRIVQVLVNLLTNAARHSDASSAIQLSAARKDGYVRIRVVDSGQGVPTERLHLLFQKFVRINAEDGEREGSGLGLAICKGIVEAHGGRIWAESDGPGLGTRFTFTIPVANGMGARAGREQGLLPRHSPGSVTEKTRILAVDDDPQALRYVREALSEAGYSPTVTGNPGEVLDLFARDRPSLVLLDLVLPGSDGIELMKHIQAIKHVPVIFLSAYGRDETIATALQMGAADYMVKPFSPTELVARVGAALRKGAGLDDTAPEPYVLGDLNIDYTGRAVSVAGRPVKLTATEYGLLFELSINAGRVVTHEHLLEHVWGWGHSSGKGTVRTFVKRLRRKLGDDAGSPLYIFAVPRVGYRMGKPAALARAAP